MESVKMFSIFLLSCAALHSMEINEPNPTSEQKARQTEQLARETLTASLKLESQARKALHSLPLTRSEFITLRQRFTEEVIYAVDYVKDYDEHLARYLPSGYYTEASFNKLKTRRTEEFIPSVDTVSDYEGYLLYMRKRETKQ